MPRPRSLDTDTAVGACVEQFWDSTYASTSTDELCESTGLSRSSLYNAFGSKRDLYLLALERYSNDRAAERAELTEAAGSGADALRGFMRAVLDTQWQDPDRRACLGINGCIETGPHDGEITRALERGAVDFHETIAALVARGQLDGSIDDRRTASELAWLIHTMLDGLQVRGRVHPDRADIDRCLATVMALLEPREALINWRR
ncbi:TetR/AcrR family transcriptional regulator [Pseudactinotalea sp.]|uniref:TetR/AcrR family transcriptional regulator n=1 Tax=Pseudactinotalea sp. TaxID=1926260 RepID=UPI003B3AF2CE